MSEANSISGNYFDADKGEWVKRPAREPPFVLYFGLPLVSSLLPVLCLRFLIMFAG